MKRCRERNAKALEECIEILKAKMALEKTLDEAGFDFAEYVVQETSWDAKTCSVLIYPVGERFSSAEIAELRDYFEEVLKTEQCGTWDNSNLSFYPLYPGLIDGIFVYPNDGRYQRHDSE